MVLRKTDRVGGMKNLRQRFQKASEATEEYTLRIARQEPSESHCNAQPNIIAF
jgi:hypothetical protein